MALVKKPGGRMSRRTGWQFGPKQGGSRLQNRNVKEIFRKERAMKKFKGSGDAENKKGGKTARGKQRLKDSIGVLVGMCASRTKKELSKMARRRQGPEGHK